MVFSVNVGVRQVRVSWGNEFDTVVRRNDEVWSNDSAENAQRDLDRDPRTEIGRGKIDCPKAQLGTTDLFKCSGKG
jgi:hypothetical protein